MRKKVKCQTAKLTAVLFSAVLVTAGCNKTEEASKAIPEIPVAVTAITGGSLSDSTLITGTIKPGKDVELMPTNAGELVSVSVKKGDYVKKGQILAKLDTRDYELNLKQARTALSRVQNNEKRAQEAYKQAKGATSQAQDGVRQAEATLRQATVTLRQAEDGVPDAEDGVRQSEIALRQAEDSLNQAKNGRLDGIEGASYNLQNAKNQWDDAKRNLERMQGLFKDGLISQQQFDQAKNAEIQASTAYQQAKLSEKQANRQDNLTVLQSNVDQAKVGVDQAKSAVNKARYGIDQAKVGVEQAQVGIDRAKKTVEDAKTNENIALVGVKEASIAVQEAQIGVEQAQKKVDDMIIKAPVSGEVLDVMAEEGEFVSNQSPFARLVSADVVHLEALVTPEQMFTLEEGEKVEVHVPSLKRKVSGTVNYISPTSEQAGLFKVEVQLPNDGQKLRPGMVAQLNLKEVLVANSFLAPTEAVVEKNDSAYIFVVQNDKAVQKEIEIIRAETDFTAINGDIEKGDKVVVKGQNLLKDGDQIRIVKEEK
ncbi:efflux RND transporter periplasmic adaptor subunit [Bacillus songklensis]|uniref:Efflux RND transporter periplasmic adaptor subunit n=1 Tax=Bacillus songklensis TaxID=1069116 RepID=A0ABV8B1W0_9BACI